jgi:hypothetical protein
MCWRRCSVASAADIARRGSTALCIRSCLIVTDARSLLCSVSAVCVHSGIAKVSGVQPPLDQEVEAIATAAFTKVTAALTQLLLI